MEPLINGNGKKICTPVVLIGVERKIAPQKREINDRRKSQIKDKYYKVSLVVESDAGASEEAVMIPFQNTLVTNLTVVTPRRLVMFASVAPLPKQTIPVLELVLFCPIILSILFIPQTLFYIRSVTCLAQV